MSWQVQEAKQRFSEVLRAAETDGPQTITRHGSAVTVIIDIDRYRKLTQSRHSFADHLLAMPQLSEDAAAVFHELEGERKIALDREIDLGLTGPRSAAHQVA
ncbi:MAG TPA: type II toxin-antitoxin system Phd/YefM family antitoxin [Aldersonia sp.]